MREIEERINENEKRTEIYGKNKKASHQQHRKNITTNNNKNIYTYYTITSLAAKNKLFIQYVE